MQAAAAEFKAHGTIPFAGFVTDPCDGRSQGTTGMMDSLPYRNDAAIVLRRLIRSLPTRKGVMGVATCDKGLPAMMLALAAQQDQPTILVPGGVTLPPEEGEDAGKVQTIGVRYAHGEITVEEAAELGCKSCASPGGGCQFLGTAATSPGGSRSAGHDPGAFGVGPLRPTHLARDGATLGPGADLPLPRPRAPPPTSSPKTPSTTPWSYMRPLAAAPTCCCISRPLPMPQGCPALRWRTGQRINRSVPRLVDALPNGPVGHPTVQVFMAGGVPEVMLHLRELGLLRLNARTVHNRTLDQLLDEWEMSERRKRVREHLLAVDGVDPDVVIMDPATARARGLTSTVTFPRGNLAPEGSVVKSTSIDRCVVDPDGVYRKLGTASVFTSERAAIAAIKGQGDKDIQPGDIIVVAGCGPMGSGMEETYQLTSALKYMKWGKEVALITDARFSGVSTGACIGHIGPEGLAGGPIGQRARWRHDPNHYRHRQPGRVARFGRPRWSGLRRGNRRSNSGPASTRSGPGRRPTPTRRHTLVGRAPSHRRWYMGRLCL